MIEEIHLQKPWAETEQEDYDKALLELAEIAGRVEAVIEAGERELIEWQRERDCKEEEGRTKELLGF